MRLCLICIIIIGSWGCAQKNEPEILNPSDMGKVLWDIMLVEEYSNIKVTRDSVKNLDKERLGLYQKVFQLHKITREDFSASLKYYASKPDVMKNILDSLAVRNDRQKKIPLPKQ